jgi:hypothetical protein
MVEGLGSVTPHDYVRMLHAVEWPDVSDPAYHLLCRAADEGEPALGGFLLESAELLTISDQEALARFGADFVQEWLVQVAWRHPEDLDAFTAGVERNKTARSVLGRHCNMDFEALPGHAGQRLARVIREG